MPLLTRARTLAAFAVLSVSVAVPYRAGAQGGGTGSPPAASVLPADNRLVSGLGGLGVDSPAYRSAAAAYQRAVADLAEATTTAAARAEEIVGLDTAAVVQRDALAASRVEAQRERAALESVDASLREVLIESYTGHRSNLERLFERLNSGDAANDTLYRQSLGDAVGTAQAGERREVAARSDAADAALDAARTALSATGARAAAARVERNDAARSVITLTAAIPGLEQRLRDTRLLATVVGTDIPLLALNAYVKAGRRLAADRPSCGITWWMIAALGRIESRHGSYGASQLVVDGRASPKILGPVLDGTNGTARIADTDKGVLDGDTVLDRAVGPMQFIPETWAQYRRDGNGDGVFDPNNLYDASLAAGVYLCVRGGGALTNTANLRAAYLAYNRSSQYVNDAIANGESYRTLGV
jgi:membrane-bound lytic murein transglycosylase B